ncbi:MAG: acyl-ACP--UDP-N-acetylglucosamine O-acyltransferase [Nitrospinae bacterium]|nr:acyl-ACP--UDP-N-acetylglucosamine O-acyltransferase [Nitrospinota bacterium]
MNDIAPTSHIHPEAQLGQDLQIGPGAFVGADVIVRDGCEIGQNATIQGPAVIGERCRIFPNAVIGLEAQVVDLQSDSGGVEIGAGTIIRETATIHRSMHQGQNTIIGRKCYIMVGAHVGHDCRVGDGVIMVNHCSLGGHVEVGNNSFISNFIGVHQRMRVGEGVILVGPVAVRKDVPPFVKMAGAPFRVVGLNVVGLRRRGVSAEARADIKRAYGILFNEPGTMAQKLEKMEAHESLGAEIRSVVEFVRNSKNGIYQGRV